MKKGLTTVEFHGTKEQEEKLKDTTGITFRITDLGPEK